MRSNLTALSDGERMPLSDSQAPALATEDLVVELGGTAVLRGVTASVRPGEAVALLGGNGSGKTTLVRAALGLVPIQAGRIRLFGELTRPGSGPGTGSATSRSARPPGSPEPRSARWWPPADWPGAGPSGRPVGTTDGPSAALWRPSDWPAGPASSWPICPAASSSG